MEPSSPTPRSGVFVDRRVIVAALAALLLIVVAATAGLFLLAPSAKVTTSPGSPLAGASATPTASLGSASPSMSESPSASATATAVPVTLRPGATPTPRPTMIHLSGTFSLDASRPYSGIIVYPADRLEVWATGQYWVTQPATKGSVKTPAGVGCTGGNSNTGFLAPSLTKFAVVFWYNNPSESASFCLAGHAIFNASVEAVLKFAVNDDQYGDNSGTITINWTIDRQP